MFLPIVLSICLFPKPPCPSSSIFLPCPWTTSQVIHFCPEVCVYSCFMALLLRHTVDDQVQHAQMLSFSVTPECTNGPFLAPTYQVTLWIMFCLLPPLSAVHAGLPGGHRCELREKCLPQWGRTWGSVLPTSFFCALRMLDPRCTTSVLWCITGGPILWLGGPYRTLFMRSNFSCMVTRCLMTRLSIALLAQ